VIPPHSQANHRRIYVSQLASATLHPPTIPTLQPFEVA
jgi:hypothetical protein